MDDDATPPALLRTLPSWLLNRAALTATRVVADHLAVLGLRRSHFPVLLTLDEAGPLSQAGLGRRLDLDRSDLHAIVGDLEELGLVERRRDPADRRANSLRLTASGRATLKRAMSAVLAAQDDLLAPLSEREREQLARLLARVVDARA